jgi:hypothetical protein
MGAELAGQTNAGVGQITVMVLRAFERRKMVRDIQLFSDTRSNKHEQTQKTYAQPIRVSQCWCDRQSGKQKNESKVMNHDDRQRLLIFAGASVRFQQNCDCSMVSFAGYRFGRADTFSNSDLAGSSLCVPLGHREWAIVGR